MDNEKLNNEEELEVTEPVEEVAEETAETTEAEEVVEEIAEEAETDEVGDETVEDAEADEVEETDDADADGELVEVEDGELEIAEEKFEPGMSGGKVGAIIGGIVAVIIVLAAILWYTGVINPYEKGYVDVSGVTLEELADQSGYSLKEYKKINGLSWLMPKSTNENAVKNNIKVKTTIAQSGMAFEDFKEYYGWGDNITENSTVGKALGETKLSIILGTKDMDEETANKTLESFKEFYGFGDDVTLDTLYKDVRVAIDKKTRETRIEEEKKAEEETKATDAADDEKAEAKEETETVPEEAPAE